jgi:hypothetical protein
MSYSPRFSGFALPLLCLASVAFGVSGCAPALSPAGAQLREAAPEAVGECMFLGTVVGNVGRFDPSPIDDAKIDALNHAAEKGASRVVWASVSAGRGATAMARAYRCSGG